MRKNILLIILLLFIHLTNNIVVSSPPVNFACIDSLSYNQYLDKNWEGLLETVDQALKNDIDYYYLRMRAGWAFYSLKNYRKAIPHYRKALEFNSNDPVATEMLIYCYDYSGRKNDARKLAITMPAEQNKPLKNSYSRILTGFEIFTTWNETDGTGIVSNIYETPFPETEGLQKVPARYAYTSLSLSHRIGKGSLLARHTAGMLNRSEFSLAINNDGLAFPIEEQPVFQLDYQLALDYTPIYGLRISPAIYYSYTRIPLYLFENYGRRNKAPRTAFEYTETTSTSWSIKADYDFYLFSAGMSWAGGEINYFQVQQMGLHGRFFPLGNLNLYYTGAVFLQQKRHESATSNHLIHRHELGFKITDRWWMELESMHGPVNAFIDTDHGIVYNNLEILQNSYQATAIIIPGKGKMSLHLGMKYGESVSAFYPDGDPVHTINNNEFTFLNFTGGLIWKF